jgi:hypothetical protein
MTYFQSLDSKEVGLIAARPTSLSLSLIYSERLETNLQRIILLLSAVYGV